jgi:hypothetical protein
MSDAADHVASLTRANRIYPREGGLVAVFIRATIPPMASNIERSRSRPPILKKAAAGIVLVIVAALVLKLLIGFVIAIFWVAVVVAVIAAVLWAVKTIVW